MTDLVRVIISDYIDPIETIGQFDNFLMRLVFPNNRINRDFIRDTQIILPESLTLHDSFLIYSYCYYYCSDTVFDKIITDSKIIIYGDEPVIHDHRNIIMIILSKKFIKYLARKTSIGAFCVIM